MIFLKRRTGRQLSTAIFAVPYLGPDVIGIVSGMAAITELALFVRSVNNLIKWGFNRKDMLLFCLSFITMSGAGVFFLFWSFMKINGVM